MIENSLWINIPLLIIAGACIVFLYYQIQYIKQINHRMAYIRNQISDEIHSIFKHLYGISMEIKEKEASGDEIISKIRSLYSQFSVGQDLTSKKMAETSNNLLKIARAHEKIYLTSAMQAEEIKKLQRTIAKIRKQRDKLRAR